MTLDSFFRGRTVLVTGASGGIGADIARQLGAAGARVLLVARTEAALDAVADEVRARGGEARTLAADLGAAGAAEALVARLGERVDVLVANAGIGIKARFAETASDDIDTMAMLNMVSLTALARLLLPEMLAARHGGILTVASTAAFVPAPTFAVYAATKAYVLSLTDALHTEVRGSGVHATCLCPGPVPTGFGARAGMPPAFFASALTGSLPSATVARAGLTGLARNRRRVVPGVINRVQAAATRFIPTGPAMRVAEVILGR
ncbi:MAG TPA: SDR family NAD(P)-dependent oxidoreductase [Rubricoccaceae bacterium]|jgi:hypothetical protein